MRLSTGGLVIRVHRHRNYDVVAVHGRGTARDARALLNMAAMRQACSAKPMLAWVARGNADGERLARLAGFRPQGLAVNDLEQWRWDP